MTEILSRLSSGDLAMLLLLSMLMFTLLVVVLSRFGLGAWRRVREREMAASIVHNLAERGVPPTEIIQILEAAGLTAKQADPPDRPFLGGRSSQPL